MHAHPTARAFSMIEMVLVIVIIGVIAAIAMPRFADAGSGRRLSSAKAVIEQDIEAIRLRARATGKLHTLIFYPSDEMYVAFEGTDIKRDAIVHSRVLTDEPLSLELSRTNIGGDESVQINAFGDIEKDFSIGILDGGTEVIIAFTGVDFSRATVTNTHTPVEIKAGIVELNLGDGGIDLKLGL
jgi:prepilin-type N-terminal cleavage/methylation domain-containing protein